MPRHKRKNYIEKFVNLPHWVMKTEAYRSMKPGPRALLFEIIMRFNGSNNGSIGLGHREAMHALDVVSPNAVAGYFKELLTRGFIRQCKSSGFNIKDTTQRTSSEYALAWLPVGNGRANPSFKDWKPETLNK